MQQGQGSIDLSTSGCFMVLSRDRVTITQSHEEFMCLALQPPTCVDGLHPELHLLLLLGISRTAAGLATGSGSGHPKAVDACTPNATSLLHHLDQAET